MKRSYLIVLFSVIGLSTSHLSAPPKPELVEEALDAIDSQLSSRGLRPDLIAANNAWIAWHNFIANPWNKIHELKARMKKSPEENTIKSLVEFQAAIKQQLSTSSHAENIKNGLVQLNISKKDAVDLTLKKHIKTLIEATKSYHAWLSKKTLELAKEIEKKSTLEQKPSRGRASNPRSSRPHSTAHSTERSTARKPATPPHKKSVSSPRHRATHGGAGGYSGDSDDDASHASRHSPHGGSGGSLFSLRPSSTMKKQPAPAPKTLSSMRHHSPRAFSSPYSNDSDPEMAAVVALSLEFQKPPPSAARTLSRSTCAAPMPFRSRSPRRASSSDGVAKVIPLNPSRQEGNNCAICAILNAKALFDADARTPLERVALQTSPETSSYRKAFNETIINADVRGIINDYNRRNRSHPRGTTDTDIKRNMDAIGTDSMIKILKDLNLMGHNSMFKSSENAELAIVENAAIIGNIVEILSARYHEGKRIVTIFYVGEQRAGAVGHWVCTVYQKERDNSQTIYRADSEYNGGDRSADITDAETSFGMQLASGD